MEQLMDYLGDSPNPFLRALFWIIGIIAIAILVVFIGGVVLVGGYFISQALNTRTTADGAFTYSIHDDYVALNSYNGHEAAIVLPVSIEDMPVDAILNMKDKNGVVEEITIPDALSFTAGDINPSVICVHFPVLQRYCVSDAHPTLRVIDGALYTKDGKVLLSYPAGRTGEAVIPQGVETLWPCAFQNASVASVVLPASLRTISDYSMSDFRVMRHLEIPAGVEEIGPYAFINSDDTFRRLKFILTQDSPAHTFCVENDLPILEVRPAT